MALVAFQIFIKIKPDRLDEFMRVALADAAESIKEPDNLRFEIWRQPDDPTRLVVFEIYRSEDAVAFHRQQPYVQAWRAAVEAMTDEYTRMPLLPVAPSEDQGS